MSKMVVIEGVSCAGKTTLLHRLGASNDIKVIQEHSCYVGGGRNFPPPAEDYDTAMRNREYFINIDLIRWREISEIISLNKDVVIDRSPLSCMAYMFAARNINEFDVLYDTIDLYEYHFGKGSLFHPHAYIYIDVSMDTIRSRNKTREYDLGILVDEVMIKLMKQFYEVYFSTLHPSNWYHIDGDDTIDNVYDKVLSCIEEIDTKKHNRYPKLSSIKDKL